MVKDVFDLEGIAIIGHQWGVDVGLVERRYKTIHPSRETRNDSNEKGKCRKRNLAINDLRQKKHVGHKVANEEEDIIANLARKKTDIGFDLKIEKAFRKNLVSTVEPWKNAVPFETALEVAEANYLAKRALSLKL